MSYSPQVCKESDTTKVTAHTLQGIFLTQESDLRLLCLTHCRWILYQLGHQGSHLITADRANIH